MTFEGCGPVRCDGIVATTCGPDRPMRLAPTRFIALLFPFVLAAAPALAAPACPPDGWPLERLDALRQGGFVVADAGERATLAYSLANCLAASDPHLRDEIAYEALSTW